jgi:hypothetical protein
MATQSIKGTIGTTVFVQGTLCWRRGIETGGLFSLVSALARWGTR